MAQVVFTGFEFFGDIPQFVRKAQIFAPFIVRPGQNLLEQKKRLSCKKNTTESMNEHHYPAYPKRIDAQWMIPERKDRIEIGFASSLKQAKVIQSKNDHGKGNEIHDEYRSHCPDNKAGTHAHPPFGYLPCITLNAFYIAVRNDDSRTGTLLNRALFLYSGEIGVSASSQQIVAM